MDKFFQLYSWKERTCNNNVCSDSCIILPNNQQAAISLSFSFFLSFCQFVEKSHNLFYQHNDENVGGSVVKLSNLNCLSFHGINACLFDFVLVLRQWAEEPFVMQCR